MRFFPIPLCLLAVFTVAGCTSLPLNQEGAWATSSGADGTTAVPASNLPSKWSWADLRKAPQERAEQAASDETATTEPRKGDIWNRLRGEFALPRHDDDPNVQTQLNWYANQTDYLDRVFGRAERYLHFVLEEVERREMPTELALLPIIESGYYPYALSPSQAAGLWQFIPSTGEHFGLKQNWWYDGRRDIYASTRAALDYLESLHTRFNGDWLLALAAYNSGEGTVDRAIKKNQRVGKATDFWSLDLPRETRAYVPKLLALSALVSDPEKYGVDLKSIPDAPYLTSVNVGEQLDLAVAAELAGMPLEDLQRLNPGFTRLAMAPEGPHRLLLPTDKAEGFQQRLAELPEDQRMRWQRHQVQRGETLQRIAKRYGVTPALLRQVNNLSGNTVRAGRYLLIPETGLMEKSAVAKSAPARKEPTLARTQQSAKAVRAKDTAKVATRDDKTAQAGRRQAPPKGKESAVASRSAGKSAADGLESVHYTVQPGDSLGKIAGRFKVSVAELRKWNTLKGNSLRPGQLLTVKIGLIREAQNTY